MNLEQVLEYIEELGCEPAGSRAMRDRHEQKVAYDLFVNSEGNQFDELVICLKYPYATSLINAKMDTTDWDYSMPNDPNLHSKLEDIGFVKHVFDNYYSDSLSVCCHKLRIPTFTEEGFYKYHLIEVVSKNDFDRYKKVWDRIDPEYYAKHLWKRSKIYSDKSRSDTILEIKDHFNQLFKLV